MPDSVDFGRAEACGGDTGLCLYHRTIPVDLDKAYTLALWLIAKTEVMRRTHRFPTGSQYSELRRRRPLATLL